MQLTAFVLSSVALSIQLYANWYREEDQKQTLHELKKDLGLPQIKTYDFIVVGAGTSGSVLAFRLSEQYSVLLLEVGGKPVPQVQVPYLQPAVSFHPDINVIYPSIPQANAALSNGGILFGSTGKMMGGTGSHNGMAHNRGSPFDYNNYAKITGDDTWKYQNVLQYFKKYQNFKGPLLTKQNLDDYGHDGLLPIETGLPDILPTWLNAGKQLGFNIADSGFQTESFTTMETFLDKGERVSTYNRYIKPIQEENSNLRVLTYSMVSQILLDSKNKAYGVAYKRHGIPQIAHASKEVIVSAGVFASPLLLMKSGIGDPKILQEAQISVKVNLPGVGKNLGDHVSITLNNIRFNTLALPKFPSLAGDIQFQKVLKEYEENGTGPLTQISWCAQAFIVSSRAKAEGESQWPDIQLAIQENIPTSVDEVPTITLWVNNNRPKSRGTVTLNATAYKAGLEENLDLAVVDFKIFEGPSATDVDVLVEGAILALKILETPAFKSIGAIYSDTPIPQCASETFRFEKYWRCYIRQTVIVTYHSVGTCKMGKIHDPMTVVDSKFRIKGVSNLRVVDASVLAVVPNANTNGPVVMIAEKASDDILKTWEES